MVVLVLALAAADFQPSPQLSPKQVVEAQLEALRANDSPRKDSGIEVAFRFASPANKIATGPLKKFKTIVRSEAYAPMIDHSTHEFGEVELLEDTAAVPVILTASDGRQFGYVFLLGRQRGGPLRDCWMTDGVQLVGEAPAKRTGGISL
ncbi:MAG: DUF4864 domain-containing protein [Myxococcota bacterium]